MLRDVIGRGMGAPVVYFHPQGRRVLRLQAPHGHLHQDGTAARLDGHGSERVRAGEVPGLPDAVTGRGFAPGVAVLDKGYDGQPMHDACESRNIRPVIALKETPAVKAGAHKPRTCGHGEWVFAGADAKRGATKWRCPTGECSPASVGVKADRLHPLIPLGTERWKSLYRQRTAVERGFGRLKNELGLLPLRMRHIERVRLHADLTILAQLASALAATRDT